MWLAVIAGCLVILGIMRMAQALGHTKQRESMIFSQGFWIFLIGAVLGFVAFFLRIT